MGGPELRLYIGTSETFRHPALCLWAVVYPTGHVAHRAVLRHAYSHRRRGRSKTVPTSALNVRRSRPEKVTAAPASRGACEKARSRRQTASRSSPQEADA
jgi:hypothetical protein